MSLHEIQAPWESLFGHQSEDTREKCDTFILEHSDDLIDLFAAKLTPQEICIFFKCCDHPEDLDGNTATNEIDEADNFQIFKEPLLKDVRPLPDSGEGCFFCTLIMNGIDQSTANRKTNEEVKEVMFKVCENLPESTSNPCLDWLRKYADIVLDVLGEYTLKEVCERVNVCTRPGVMMSPDSHVNSMMMGVDDCTMCQEISSEIERMVEHAQGSISIDDALRSVCARLPLAAASQVSAVGVLPKRKLLSDGQEFEEGNIVCDMCVTLVQHFHEVVPLDTTVHEYKMALLGICRHVRSFNEDCADLVEPNFDKIFENLKNGMTPKEICVGFKRCHGTAAPSAELPAGNVVLTQDEDYHLDENMHPLKLSIACESFVTDKGPGINDGMARNLTVQELCISVGSCSSEDVELSREVPAKLHNVELPKADSSSSVFDGNSPTTAEQFDEGECKMCLHVLNNLKEQIPNARGQTSPADIKSALVGLCTYLRKPESKKLCTNYVTGTGDNVIDVLATINPQQLCILFLACPASGASPSRPAQPAPEVPRAFAAAENHVSGREESHLSFGLLKNDGSSNNDEDDDSETNNKKVTTVPMPVLETDDCTVCVNMALIVYQLVNDEIRVELDQALQRACSVIHPLYHPRCLELMAKYQEQLRIKVLLFPRMFPTEYCKEFDPPVCAPSPIYGLGPANPHPSIRFKPVANTRSTVPDEDKESILCELCQHTMFRVGPLMSNPKVTFKQVYNAITDSCNSFTGDKHQQCVNMIVEHRYYMEVELFRKPRTPFYQVCYQMTNPLCSAKYINPALRSKLMDAFLSEFPKGFVGNEQAFNFASEMSDFASMIMYFMNPDLVNLNLSDTSESSTASLSESIAKHTTDGYDDDDDDFSTMAQPEGKDDGTLCEICNHVIRKVKPYIQFPVLQKFLQAEIEKSCYDIQPLHFSKCIKFVANYSSILKETALFEISIHTEDICTLTVPQFCRTNVEDNPLINSKKWHSMTDLRDIDKIDEIKERDSNEDDENDDKVDPNKEALVPYVPILKSSVVIPNFVPKAAVPVSDCVICHKIVENIEPQIQGSKNMDEIKDSIMRACFSIEGEYFSQCLEFLPKYGPHLRDSIIADSTVPPSEICLNTKMLSCAPVKSEVPIPPIAPLSKQVPVDVEILEKKLHPLGSGSLMREIALKVCEKIIEKLLSGMEEVCTTFINKHFPEEENYYGGALRPLIGVEECDVCQEMMAVVSTVKNDQIGTQFSLHETLYGSCGILPGAHRWLCEGVLRKFGDKMEPYLESCSRDYMSVCNDLQPGPCHATRSQNINDDNSDDSDDSDDDKDDEVAGSSLRRQFVNQVLTQHRLVQKLSLSLDERHEDTSSDCLLCQAMVKEVRKQLIIDHSKPIKLATDNVCQYLSEVARHNCSEIVLASGTKIEEGLRWFVYDSPSYVCEQSELCDPYRIDTDTKDPCKEGPDFWCLSFQNADQCDQIEYCQAKYRQDDD